VLDSFSDVARRKFPVFPTLLNKQIFRPLTLSYLHMALSVLTKAR